VSNEWDDPLQPAILSSPPDPLSAYQVTTLWRIFIGIESYWNLGEDTDDVARNRPWDIELARSRWLDMLEARSSGTPDYRGEYVNAVDVFEELVRELPGEDRAITKIYGETKVTRQEDATTRLAHAKFFVVNDFIKCFIIAGGFRRFVKASRNYAGYMGGSRFREWPPVRTRDIQ
jgi:hypothetical protein